MAALSIRADMQELPPVDAASGVARALVLLTAEAERDTWRIVEAFSGSGLPFDLELQWSAGSGTGARAQITVARSTRISVFARSVRIAATNLTDQPNRAGVTVADGFAPTHNQWEHRADHASGVFSVVPVPPFAETLRVDLADPLLAALATLRVLDGLGVLRAAYRLSDQPPAGIPVGGASALALDLAVDTAFRAVFHLSL